MLHTLVWWLPTGGIFTIAHIDIPKLDMESAIYHIKWSYISDTNFRHSA